MCLRICMHVCSAVTVSACKEKGVDQWQHYIIKVCRDHEQHGQYRMCATIHSWHGTLTSVRVVEDNEGQQRVGKHKSWNHKVGTAPSPMTSPCTHPAAPYSSSSYWTKVTLSLQRYCIRPALHPCGAIRTLLRVNLEATPIPEMGEGVAIFWVYATLTLVTSMQPCKALYVDPWIPLPSLGDPWYAEFVMHHHLHHFPWSKYQWTLINNSSKSAWNLISDLFYGVGWSTLISNQRSGHIKCGFMPKVDHAVAQKLPSSHWWSWNQWFRSLLMESLM